MSIKRNTPKPTSVPTHKAEAPAGEDVVKTAASTAMDIAGPVAAEEPIGLTEDILGASSPKARGAAGVRAYAADPRIESENALDAAYAVAAASDADTRTKWIKENFTQFTKRTEDPKLAWLEQQLTEAGIPHLRDGESFHAPILVVAKDRLGDAQAILDREIEHNGVMTSIDEIPDDDSLFFGFDVSDMDPDEFDMDEVQGIYKPHDFLGEEGESGGDPKQDGWVNKNSGQP